MQCVGVGPRLPWRHRKGWMVNSTMPTTVSALNLHHQNNT